MTHDQPAPRREWAAEVAITPELAASLLREQFPALRARQVVLFETGWDNAAFLVDGEWLVRFPRRAIALPGVRREMAVLPRLAARLPLPVPVPELLGQPSARYPWPFWGARLLPGRELADAGLPDAARSPAAVATGRFLRALHDPGLVGLIGGGLAMDPMGRGARPGRRAAMTRERLDRLREHGIEPGPGVEGLLREAERADPPGASPAPPPHPAQGPHPPQDPPPLAPDLVVSHGDLHVRHLLVDEAGAAAGVIDWGDLCLADPAADLSIAFGGFAGAPRAALLAAYGRPPDARQELTARALAIFLCSALAEYALDEGRNALLAEAVAGLGRAVSA
jgi:aminoglycoside phosphotransferase (APT) family kinase protein